MESRPKGIIGTVTVRSQPAGTVDIINKLKEAARVYKKRTFWQWLLRRPRIFSHFDQDFLDAVKIIIKAGKIETKQRNLVMASLNNGYDILVQFLLSGYTGSFAFPLGIAWGEIGTGAANPSNLDVALTAPTNRMPVSYGADNGFTEAQVQFFFPDAILANETYYEFGTFIGGSSSIGTGNIFNHALFTNPYVKTAGVDSTVEVDFQFSIADAAEFDSAQFT